MCTTETTYLRSSRLTVKIACDLDDLEFISVAAVTRAAAPWARHPISSSKLPTATSRTPVIVVAFPIVRMFRPPLLSVQGRLPSGSSVFSILAKRSCMFSLCSSTNVTLRFASSSWSCVSSFSACKFTKTSVYHFVSSRARAETRGEPRIIRSVLYKSAKFPRPLFFL